jgi:hypothetical protein
MTDQRQPNTPNDVNRDGLASVAIAALAVALIVFLIIQL